MIKVQVEWETDGAEVDLPSIVTIPSDVKINNEEVCSYLSDTYGWLVLDWRLYVPK